MAELDHALEEAYRSIDETAAALEAAEESKRRLRVRENAAMQELWDGFQALRRLLLSRFSEAIGAESLPRRVAHEEELYSTAIRREAARLGKGAPGGIVVLKQGPSHAGERSSELLA